MRPEELRHGNVIAFDDGSSDIVEVDYLFKVDELEDMWFVQWNKISGDGGFEKGNSILEDFEPVPLSPDVLRKCGFIIYEIKRVTLPLLSDIEYVVETYELFDEVSVERDVSNNRYTLNDMVEIKYLHQLQNICYSFERMPKIIYKPNI